MSGVLPGTLSADLRSACRTAQRMDGPVRRSGELPPGDFVELGVLIWSRKPAIHKKTPQSGVFLWMARLERLCGTSLCRTPTGGLRPSSGPRCARPKSLRAILSNWASPEFCIWPQTNHPIKKPRFAGPFYWMARLERFELPTARFVASTVN